MRCSSISNKYSHGNRAQFPSEPKTNRNPSVFFDKSQNIIPSTGSSILNNLPAVSIGISGKVAYFLVPPVLEDVLDGDLALFRRLHIFQIPRLVLWEKASIVSSGRGGEPVDLVHLFAYLPSLLEPCRTVDCDGDVENRGRQGKAAGLNSAKSVSNCLNTH